MRGVLIASAIALSAVAWPAVGQDRTAQGWITAPNISLDDKPVVLRFRRVVDLTKKPVRFPVRVTADNRFILYVNGARVAAGPSTGDITHWRIETIDLARYLRRGRNAIAAVVWDAVKPVNLPPDATPKQIEHER